MTGGGYRLRRRCWSALCSGYEYDAIILDIMLPRKDGEVLRKFARVTFTTGSPLTARDWLRAKCRGLKTAPTTT